MNSKEIAEAFMSIMGEYTKRQDEPGFDVTSGVHELYADLSNLYHENT